MVKQIFKGFCNSLYFSFIVVQFIFHTTDQSIAQSRAEVKISDDIPTLFIDGEPYPPFAYMSYLGEKKYYKEIAATGIHLYNILSYLGKKRDKFHFKSLFISIHVNHLDKLIYFS